MAPMTRSFSPGGIPTDDVAAYYRRRAEGGVGLIVTEGTVVERPAARNHTAVPVFYGEALPGWKKVVDEVHKVGGVSRRKSGTSDPHGVRAPSGRPSARSTARQG